MKYDRTPHLCFSPSKTLDPDDKVLKNHDCFKGKKLIFTEKMDGENTCCSRDAIHARSCDGYGKSWQHYMKSLYACFSYLIPEGLTIYGECVYAKHSICYEKLTTYFYVFAALERGSWLSWSEVVLWARRLGLDTVPVITAGNLKEIPIPTKSAFGSVCEGYVVRNFDSFPKGEFGQNVAKSVRPHHVQTDEHWTKNWIPNPSPSEDPIERVGRLQQAFQSRQEGS